MLVITNNLKMTFLSPELIVQIGETTKICYREETIMTNFSGKVINSKEIKVVVSRFLHLKGSSLELSLAN